jgi:hypothetical protein
MLLSPPFYLGLETFNGPWFKAIAGWLSVAMALRQRTITMEVPITLGFGVLCGTSAYQVISHQRPAYCDSLCGLNFLSCVAGCSRKKPTNAELANQPPAKSRLQLHPEFPLPAPGGFLCIIERW